MESITYVCVGAGGVVFETFLSSSAILAIVQDVDSVGAGELVGARGLIVEGDSVGANDWVGAGFVDWG